jgi:chemotaxis protein MotB
MNLFHRTIAGCVCAGFLTTVGSGCFFAPRSQLVALESQNRLLAAQNNAQASEMENMATHSHVLESKVMQAEEQLASLDSQWRSDRKRLVAIEGELTDGRGNRLPAGISSQLAGLSRKYPNLHFDETTGACKLDTDVLFDSGEAELKEDAAEMLGEFGRILKQPEARDLKLMVCGHTDALKIARREVRDRFSDNFHLSTARALAVAEYLKKSGVPETRLGVSGFGGNQPIASNDTAEERRRNRRVEVFILPPEAQVVGWTETTTSLY